MIEIVQTDAPNLARPTIQRRDLDAARIDGLCHASRVAPELVVDAAFDQGQHVRWPGLIQLRVNVSHRRQACGKYHSRLFAAFKNDGR